MKQRLRFFAEYGAVRLLVWLARPIPWSWLPGLARGISRAAFVVIGNRRQIAARNFELAFPQTPLATRRSWEARFWENITLSVLEMLRMSWPCEEWISRSVVLENRELLDAALRQGKGVIIHTAHFDNWELAGLTLSLAGYPIAVVGKVQKNSLLNDWHNENRSRFGMKVISHRKAVRESQEHLAQGGCLAILMDQNLYKGGVFVKFFNQWAATTTLSAFLRLKTKSPMVGVYMRRRGAKHYLRFEPVEWPQENQELSKVQRTYNLTQYLTGLLELWIRRDPANWLWGHDRWKRSAEATPEIVAEQSGKSTDRAIA